MASEASILKRRQDKTDKVADAVIAKMAADGQINLQATSQQSVPEIDEDAIASRIANKLQSIPSVQQADQPIDEDSVAEKVASKITKAAASTAVPVIDIDAIGSAVVTSILASEGLKDLIDSSVRTSLNETQVSSGESLTKSDVADALKTVLSNPNNRDLLKPAENKCESLFKNLKLQLNFDDIFALMKLDRVSIADMKELTEHAIEIQLSITELENQYDDYETKQSLYEGFATKKVRSKHFTSKQNEMTHYKGLAGDYGSSMNKIDGLLVAQNKIFDDMFKSSGASNHHAAKNLRDVCENLKDIRNAEDILTRNSKEFCDSCWSNSEYQSKSDAVFLCGMHYLCNDLVGE